MRVFFLRQLAAFCLLLLGSVANSAVATASGSEADSRSISLHEAVMKTIEHNPDLRAFDYRLKAWQGRVQQAGLPPSPELSFQLEDVLGTESYKAVDRAQATLSISWVLERGVRQRYVDAARAGSSLIKVEADIKMLNAAAETARRYLVSMAYQIRGAIADKTVQLAEETINSVRRRVQAGNTPEAELSRAEAELARRKLERENIEHQLLSANRRLAAQWGERVPTFSRVEGDITHLRPLVPFETLKSQLPQNPEFTRLLSEQLLKEAELQLALAREKSSWRFNAGIRHLNDSNDQALVAGFTIPFGERTRNPGRIAEARANLAEIERKEQAVRTQIETAFYVMYMKLQHSVHIIKTVRDEIIPPLEQALIETRRAYRLGRYSYLELRSVQAELLDAHNALVEASVNAHRNIIEIERLTGVPVAQSTVLLK